MGERILRIVQWNHEHGTGTRFPIAMRIAARKKQAMFIFEYAGETLYAPFADPLMELTTEIEPVYGLS